MQTPRQQLFWNPFLANRCYRKLIDSSKWPQYLVYYRFSQYVYPSNNLKCPKNTILCFFLALRWQNCMIFDVSWTTGCIKLVDPSKWPQESIYYGCSEICMPFRQSQAPKMPFFVFIWSYMMKFQKFSSY